MLSDGEKVFLVFVFALLLLVVMECLVNSHDDGPPNNHYGAH